MSWFYLDTNANATGPVSASFILEKYHWNNGEITTDTHVWKQDIVKEWSELQINYVKLVSDVINDIQNGDISKNLLQFIMNPYTIYIHNTKHINNNMIAPIGQAQVEIEYKGYLANIDNPISGPLQPFIQNQEIIQLGMKQNAFGLELALYNMYEGDESNVYIPWRLAYGEKGAGQLIPPKTDVLFQLKIIKIKKQGTEWQVRKIKFDKWLKMKQKWNNSKKNSNSLYVKTDYENIVKQTVPKSKSKSKPKPKPKIIDSSDPLSGSLTEWLSIQKLPEVLILKLTNAGIHTWNGFYAINDNIDAKAKEIGLTAIQKIKVKALCRKLPERTNVIDDTDEKSKQAPPLIPPPAPLDAIRANIEKNDNNNNDIEENEKKSCEVVLEDNEQIEKVMLVDCELRNDLIMLKNNLNKFGEKFTDKKILNMYNTLKESVFVVKDIDELELQMKVIMDRLKNMRIQINELKIGALDMSKYESWNIDEIIEWICSLENGRYKKYEKQLKNGFIENEINGEYLVKMTSVDIKDVCGINNWKDRKDLSIHFNSLKN